MVKAAAAHRAALQSESSIAWRELNSYYPRMIAKNSVETSDAPSGKNSGGSASQPAPSPALLFDTINAYQKTAAIKAAIELDIFTALANSPATADVIARHAKASPRGIRILCDFLTMLGFLTKLDERYGLSPDSAVFLNRKSPAYAGGTLEFLLSEHLRGAFDLMTEAVRNGGTAQAQDGSVAPE